MRVVQPIERYDAVAIALHWAIALLILVNWPLGYFAEQIEQWLGASIVWLHKSLGLTVLAVSLVRLGWRLGHRPPPLPPSIARWRAAIARFTHGAFYVLIVALPLSGWLRTSSGPYPLVWFGLVDVPKFPVPPKSAEADLAAASHQVLALIMLALVALHVAAALHHQFRLKDALLLRMLPAWRQR